MHIPRRHRQQPIDDREPVDVEGRREVDARRHGTVFVQAQQIFLERDRGRLLGVEFPRDGVVLDLAGWGARLDDGERFGGMGLRRADGRFGLGGDVGGILVAFAAPGGLHGLAFSVEGLILLVDPGRRGWDRCGGNTDGRRGWDITGGVDQTFDRGT